MSEQSEFRFKEDEPAYIRMRETQKATKFLDIIETYIGVIEETGTRITYEKSCAIECLRNLAEALDGRYSPDVFPCLSVEQWGKVNRGEIIDYKYKHSKQ